MEIVEAGPAEGIEIVRGKLMWIDHRGGYVPDDVVKAKDKLEDQTVRKIMKFARDLAAQLRRFKLHTMADLGALDELVAEKYGFVKQGSRRVITERGREHLIARRSSVDPINLQGSGSAPIEPREG